MFRNGAQRQRPFASARRTILFVALIGVELVVAALLFGAAMRPAQAQFWGGWGGGWDSPPRPRAPVGRPRRQRDSGFSFPFFFENERRGSTRRHSRPRPTENRRRRDVARSETRAPAPRRSDVAPARTVLVLGDAMADWLGSGLEEAFAEDNELGVVRKARPGSTLIRNDPRDYDWQQGVRDALASEKADFVVMMAGLADRHAILERTQQRAATGQNTGQLSPTDPQQRAGTLLHGFRSDRWGEVYGKRIDEIIAALQAKRVPVIWVGLPPIRGTKGSEDIAFLNGIFKERAEKAGITFVDVWEGFVDEDGDFSQYGPDVMGQTRSLRSSDGVHFTRAGARKLAHFVDREIKRLLSRETPVALPIPDIPTAPVSLPGPAETPSGPAPRPVAGPVLPLTGGLAAAPAAGERLLGAGPQDAEVTDPLALKVLVKGEPPQAQAGRADNFAWPPAHAVAANDVVEPLEPPVTTATVAAQPAKPALRPLPRIGQRPSSTRTAAQPARQVQ
jgi:hypothetical protein